MKHRRRGVTILLTVAGILAAIWWLLALVFDESRDIYRYSLAYWILVPDVIHRLPPDYCTGPARYHYSAGDGLQFPRVRRYCHASDPTAAIAHYQDLFLEWGYRGPKRQIGAYDREYLYFYQGDYVLELVAMLPDRFAITYLE